jgi:hypothetical protein
VYIYEYNGTAFNTTTLTGPIEGGLFGAAVDISADGKLVVVGAPGEKSVSAGAVYFYERSSSGWQEVFSTTGLSNSNFGTSIVILPTIPIRVAVGGPSYGSGNGFVRVFQQNATGSWGALGNDILGSTAQSLGRTVAGNDKVVIMGTNLGTLRAYSFVSNGWVLATDQLLLSLPVDPVVSVACDGNNVLAGRRNASTGVERVSFLELNL